MSNHNGAARTNYVTVEDIQGLKKALAPWPIDVVTNGQGKVALLATDPDGGGWPTWAQDEAGADLELSVSDVILPFVKEGEVLVLKESGHDKLRYVTGWTTAWVRKGGDIQEVHMSLDDIYQMAAERFGVPESSITIAEY